MILYNYICACYALFLSVLFPLFWIIHTYFLISYKYTLMHNVCIYIYYIFHIGTQCLCILYYINLLMLHAHTWTYQHEHSHICIYLFTHTHTHTYAQAWIAEQISGDGSDSLLFLVCVMDGWIDANQIWTQQRTPERILGPGTMTCVILCPPWIAKPFTGSWVPCSILCCPAPST